MVNLGKKARDKVTGFEGIITCKITYLYDSPQYGIAAAVKEEGGKASDIGWFTVGRVEIIGEGISAPAVSE